MTITTGGTFPGVEAFPGVTYPSSTTSFGEGAAFAELYRLLAPLVVGDSGRDYAAAWYLDTLSYPIEDLWAVAMSPAILLDPARCPASMLGWLAQFVGINAKGLTEAQLRASIPAPEQWKRGSLPMVRLAASRAMAPGAVPTILVNRYPPTFPAVAKGYWTFIASVDDVPSQAAYERAVTAAIYAPFMPVFVYGAGQTWDEATGTWDDQTAAWNAA